MFRTITSAICISLLIFAGCNKNSTGSHESYSLEDIVGTWNMISSNLDINMEFDFNIAFLYLLDEETCVSLGGTFEDEDGDGYGCVLNDLMILTMAALTCDQMEGELNNNICIANIIEEICCEESSQTLTIGSDGGVAMVNIDSEGEETITGNIAIDGNNVVWTMDDSSILTGTLSISGDNSMSFTFNTTDNNAIEGLVTDGDEQSFLDAIDAGAISFSGILSMAMERATND